MAQSCSVFSPRAVFGIYFRHRLHIALFRSFHIDGVGLRLSGDLLPSWSQDDLGSARPRTPFDHEQTGLYPSGWTVGV